jgi:hypothetical protein
MTHTPQNVKGGLCPAATPRLAAREADPPDKQPWQFACTSLRMCRTVGCIIRQDHGRGPILAIELRAVPSPTMILRRRFRAASAFAQAAASRLAGMSSSEPVALFPDGGTRAHLRFITPPKRNRCLRWIGGSRTAPESVCRARPKRQGRAHVPSLVSAAMVPDWGGSHRVASSWPRGVPRMRQTPRRPAADVTGRRRNSAFWDGGEG